jgi:septum site-determining protein MinD
VDEESIEVCKSVDKIVIVLVPDTTSFQATQNLVEILTDRGLSDKFGGFLINKVFDDPSVIARLGRSTFRCEYLSSLPFDFASMRSFLVGDVPSSRSLLGIHVWEALSKIFPEDVVGPPARTWSPSDYREIGVSNLDSVRGGYFLGFIMILLLYMIASQWFIYGSIEEINIQLVLILTFAIGLLGLGACVEPVRHAIGRALALYFRSLSSLFSRGESFRSESFRGESRR